MIREMLETDYSRVFEIYQMGIDSRKSTFETTLPTWQEWDRKHYKHSRFVYLKNKMVIGWVAISPTSSRYAYRGVAEVSIYVDTKYQGQGIGSILMAEMIKSSETNGIWTLVSSVFPENLSTINLHFKFGFREVGYREKIASLDGIWKDTFILERRSTLIGLTSFNTLSK